MSKQYYFKFQAVGFPLVHVQSDCEVKARAYATKVLSGTATRFGEECPEVTLLYKSKPINHLNVAWYNKGFPKV